MLYMKYLSIIILTLCCPASGRHHLVVLISPLRFTPPNYHENIHERRHPQTCRFKLIEARVLCGRGCGIELSNTIHLHIKKLA